MPAGLLLASTLLPAAFQAAQSLVQRNRAKHLKESTYVPPELLMNRDLAAQQAYSRRAPGQGQSEELIRRNLATQIAAGTRSAGGDTNKAAAITAAATARADDSVRGLQAQGQQFSENAFGRMAQSNMAIAGQKRQNRDEFNRTKSDLIAASDQNMFNAISGVGSAGVAFGLNGGFKGNSRSIGVNSPFGQAIGAPSTTMMNSPYGGFLPQQIDPNNYNPVWRKPFGGPTYYPSPSYRRR